MATTIHIPAALLDRVDARAKALGISRNRLITDALEEKMGSREDWPPELVRLLASPLSPAASEELERSLDAVRRRRSPRRAPPRL